MNYTLVIEPFDCWAFDFMGHFPPSEGYTHILVAVDESGFGAHLGTYSPSNHHWILYKTVGFFWSTNR
jgi:hypothetical protein